MHATLHSGTCIGMVYGCGGRYTSLYTSYINNNIPIVYTPIHEHVLIIIDIHTHTQTHTHRQIYIYIYIETESVKIITLARELYFGKSQLILYFKVNYGGRN